MMLDGEWGSHEGGYALKLGSIFFGYVRRRGGDSIYADCWIVSLNRQQVGETANDVDYAKALVERLICDELERIVPAYRVIKARVPPRDCFWGQDHIIKWRNWKSDRAVEKWTLTGVSESETKKALKR
jgi:hypothetical protein